MALGTMSGGEVKVDFHGCARSGHNQVTCLTKILSPNKDANISAFKSDLYDNLSKKYSSSSITALDKESGFSVLLQFVAIQGIPIEVKFIYDDIDPSASSISTFQPEFVLSDTNVKGNFRNIDF